jgi:cytoskeletal protein RodZ
MSFLLSLFFTFLILSFLWNIASKQTPGKRGDEFTSEPSASQNVRKKENIVRLMMRQRQNTPKKPQLPSVQKPSQILRRLNQTSTWK